MSRFDEAAFLSAHQSEMLNSARTLWPYAFCKDTKICAERDAQTRKGKQVQKRRLTGQSRLWKGGKALVRSRFGIEKSGGRRSRALRAGLVELTLNFW